MTSSNSYDFNLTALQIIRESLELIGSQASGESVSADDYSTALRSLNMMVKAWQSEGLYLWKNTEAALFLDYNDGQYSIGSAGDNVSSDWVKNEIEVAAASGDATIDLVSASGISDNDYIGIELDDGTLQWTTVNGDPVAGVVTLDDTLDDAATAGNHVYAYTTKLQRPLEIIEARIRTEDGTDRTIEIQSRQEYMALSDKSGLGSPNLIYYDPQLTSGQLYTWPRCDNVKEYLRFTARIPVEDFDSAGNTPDFPQEWLLALSWNLASIIAPKFGKLWDVNNELKAAKFKADVAGFDRESTSFYLEPDVEYG